jgi:hypothetical protein
MLLVKAVLVEQHILISNSTSFNKEIVFKTY